jgi:phosphate starvation-inducible membrane PsiE
MPLRYFVHIADTALVTALLASVTSAAGAAISVSDTAAASDN